MPSILSRFLGRRFNAGSGNTIGGYDAVDSRGRRRSPPMQTASVDWLAKNRHRTILSASADDLARNFSIASWAIRKHLDYVADFSFQGKTTDRGYNQYLEDWWAERCKKFNFDAAARHPHRRAVRLAEAGRCIDGDVFWLKLSTGDYRGTIQAIEGDRVGMPGGQAPPVGDASEWVNGVRLDSYGRATAYAICRREGRRKVFERVIPARNMIPHASYEFRYDQVRGVSPIASALNWFRDTYEGFDYALAKMKLGQLFGLQITSNPGEGSYIGTPTFDEDADGDGVNESAPRIDLKRGPFVTELDPGEEIKMVESRNPSTETVDFLKLMVHIALRSLDIPYSFFDESFTNFYGSRGGLVQYLHSCDSKVKDLQDFLDEDATWAMSLAELDGELELPSGKDFNFLSWEFVPGGVPWWDSVKEARGSAMAIAIGASSPIREARQVGTNVFRNIDETAEVLRYAEGKGVNLVFADSSAFVPQITTEDSPTNANQ